MDAEAVRAVGRLISDTWTLIGPVVGGVLGALLAGRSQRTSDRVRLDAERDLAQRAATREMYIELLEFVSDYQSSIQAYLMRSAGLNELTPEQRDQVFPMSLWRVMFDKVNDNDRELARRALVMRAVGHPRVADAVDDLVQAFAGDDGAREMFVSKAVHWQRFDEARARLIASIAHALAVGENASLSDAKRR